MGHYACDMRPEWFAQDKPEPPKVTEWFKPPLLPERVGWYEAAIYDAGWIYEWRIFWDGAKWRTQRGGEWLVNQNQTWRGLTTEQTK
jgi:hypothetical protein